MECSTIQAAQSSEISKSSETAIIFDDLSELQLQIKNAGYFRTMFGRLFEDQIQITTKQLITDCIVSDLRYRSDFDFFKYQNEDEKLKEEIGNLEKSVDEALRSQNDKSVQMMKHQIQELNDERNALSKPRILILEDKPDWQFKSMGTNAIQQTFFELWDNKEIQNIYVDNFLINACEKYWKEKNDNQAKNLIEITINDLFLDHTSQFPEWRIVEIQQRIIDYEVKKYSNIFDVENSKILQVWFETLSRQSDAQRCVHYMFRQKLEKIDFTYLTWHNLMRIYEKYQSMERGSFNLSRESSQSLSDFDSGSFMSSREDSRQSEAGGNLSELQKEAIKQQKKAASFQAQLNVFSCMVDIIDVISEQIFDKSSSIPYPIRQFCKCLYQALKEKFSKTPGATEIDNRILRVVSSFLLEKWLLNSVFINLHMEGLIKDFILPKYCTLNLQLMFQILYKTMTQQDWEVETPQSERVANGISDLFKFPTDVKKRIQQKTRIFFKDLLLLDSDFNSEWSLQQKLEQVSDDASKLKWRTMSVSMDSIKTIIFFFNTHIVDKPKFKGVSKWVEKVDYYHDQEKILTEKERPNLNLSQYLTDCKELNGEQIGIPKIYYLFIKLPDMPKIEIKGYETQQQASLTEAEKRVRDLLKQILNEADFMCMYAPIIKDKSSITGILTVLQKQIEKRQVFGRSNSQDFQFQIIITAITTHFNVYAKQAREVFQKFVRSQIQDIKEYNLLLNDAMNVNFVKLKQQETILQQKLKLSATLVEIVANLRKSKSRSLFSLKKNLELKIYQFKPDYLELVKQHQKSLWSEPYKDYLEKIKAKKQKDEERNKMGDKMAETMKQPIQGNVAITFLFKDQDLSDIIKNKVTDGSSVITPANPIDDELKETKVDVTKIPGFFKEKKSHDIANINDFIHKLRKTNILKQFFNKDIKEFSGLPFLFAELQKNLKSQLLEDKDLCIELDMHLEELHEYIMFQLYGEFFSESTPSAREKKFQAKYDQMFCLPPSVFHIEESWNITGPEMSPAIKMAIRQLQKIEEVQTPRTKLMQIGKAIEILSFSFQSCTGKTVTAEELVRCLPYLFVQAKINRLYAHFMFIEAFHIQQNQGDQIMVYLANLDIVIKLVEKYDDKPAIAPKIQKNESNLIHRTNTAPQKEEKNLFEQTSQTNQTQIKSQGVNQSLQFDEDSDEEVDRMDYMLKNLEHHQQERETAKNSSRYSTNLSNPINNQQKK